MIYYFIVELQDKQSEYEEVTDGWDFLHVSKKFLGTYHHSHLAIL